jgi:hypothetical protein
MLSELMQISNQHGCGRPSVSLATANGGRVPPRFWRAGYRRIRLSTFGCVRGAGFALLASFDHPHFTVVLADLSKVTIARFARGFDEPILNRPGRGRSNLGVLWNRKPTSPLNTTSPSTSWT